MCVGLSDWAGLVSRGVAEWNELSVVRCGMVWGGRCGKSKPHGMTWSWYVCSGTNRPDQSVWRSMER